ncbi:Regulatory protein RecX [hydrothermal vent metagenome]|uniref:Regulatory protein RecX n=1 Tax=hydrothermal vent metagenome TaxID=652676 RepID=A0A3B0W5E6_9ZZZZ
MKQAEAFLKEIGFSVLEDEKSSPPLLSNQIGGGRKFELRKQIESRAVYLLGIREHGAKELKSKLLTKFPETPELLAEYQEVSGFVSNVIDDVLRHCQENNWQSDERYIEQSVRNWAAKGSGPIKIRQKLQQASSRDDLICAYLDWDDSEWLELALDVLLKKYGNTHLPNDRKEQAKRMRFLQSRGFASEVIWKAFRTNS